MPNTVGVPLGPRERVVRAGSAAVSNCTRPDGAQRPQQTVLGLPDEDIDETESAVRMVVGARLRAAATRG